MRYSKEIKTGGEWENATVNVLTLMSHPYKTPDESEIKACRRAKAEH